MEKSWKVVGSACYGYLVQDSRGINPKDTLRAGCGCIKAIMAGCLPGMPQVPNSGKPSPPERSAAMKRRLPALKGSSNPCSKLNEADVKMILCALHEGQSKASLARRFGVSETTIYYIELGMTWRHVKIHVTETP